MQTNTFEDNKVQAFWYANNDLQVHVLFKEATSIHESSVVIPHTTKSYSLLHALNQNKIPIVSVEDVNAWSKSTQGLELLNDGKTDLLIVQIPEQFTLAESDKWMQKAAASLVKGSQNCVDFALTGDEAVPKVVPEQPYGRRLSEQRRSSNEIKATDLVCDAGYLIGFSGNKALPSELRTLSRRAVPLKLVDVHEKQVHDISDLDISASVHTSSLHMRVL